MAEIFESLVNGYNAGRGLAEDRRHRNALDQAGRLYASGDMEGAQNVLAQSGDYTEAAQMSALAEANRARANRTAAQRAVTDLGTDATPQARVQAAAGAYFNAGDVEQGASLTNIYNQMDDRQRQQALTAHDAIASFALGQLQRGVPTEQRQQDALAHAQSFSEQTGIPVDQVQQMIQGQTDWSDQGLQALAAEHRSASEQLQEMTRQRERGEDINRQESQFNRQLAASHSGLNAAQVRQFGNDYDRAQNQITQAVGPQVMAAMPWANQVAGNGEAPANASLDQVLINDQGMLRAVARLQTGVGVLTEGEVRDTIGNNIYNQMQAAGAAFHLQGKLPASVRQALARLVQQGVSRASAQAWQYRDNAVAEYENVNGGRAPVGWAMPSLPHPEDMNGLAAAEELARNGGATLNVNDIRISRSGRRYRYMGPGNWLPISEGDTEGYQQGLSQWQREHPNGAPPPRTSPRAATPAQQQELLAHRNDPAAIASYNRVFGPGAAEAIIARQPRNSAPAGIVGH